MGRETPSPQRLESLEHAIRSWWSGAVGAGSLPGAPPDVGVERWLARAAERAEGPHQPLAEDHDTMLIVAKAPHAGSPKTVEDIAARCLAFGAQLAAVHRLPTARASEVAHALYPDVWINFARPPAGGRIWSRLESLFDRAEFLELFGVPYDPSMVKEGRRVCEDNGLALGEFAAIWERGRQPLDRAAAVEMFGAQAADQIMHMENTYDWYRGSLPIGIHKLVSGVMAFGLRHERLYGGAPLIVLNGQFALLSRLFEHPQHGAVIFELGLPADRSAADFRHLLVGHSDVPTACRPGSIRRDAADGLFLVDDESRPVTPWANVVHASDGYLSGTAEAARLLAPRKPSRLMRTLEQRGYTTFERSEVVLADPLVATGDGEFRLTWLTRGCSRTECLDRIARFFPSQCALGEPSGGDRPLRALLKLVCDTDPTSRLEQPVAAEGDAPAGAVPQRHELPSETDALGGAALERGAVGLLVPLAGSGGRFGGYDKPEGSAVRLKPLLPLFSVQGRAVSALDVRAAHVRALAVSTGHQPPLFLSCNDFTQAPVTAWIEANPDLEVEFGRVPEALRIRRQPEGASGYADVWHAMGNLLRDADGTPMCKAIGSTGLLWAAFLGGTLERWAARGVDYVVAANTDDVGFRIDPGLVGLMVRDAAVDAVVVTVGEPTGGNRSGVKGGALRQRTTASGRRSHYVQENAPRPTGSGTLLSTNQIYCRTSALLRALAALRSGTIDPLPFYGEAKQVQIDGSAVEAWHVYQPYCDVLRALDGVLAVQIAAGPRPGQTGAFRPLKTPDDVVDAQRTLEEQVRLGDLLVLGSASG